jgi:hypothetical protein
VLRLSRLLWKHLLVPGSGQVLGLERRVVQTTLGSCCVKVAGSKVGTPYVFLSVVETKY